MKKIFSLIISVLIGFNVCLAPALAGICVKAEEPASYIPNPVDLTTRSDFGFGINTHGKSYTDYPENYLEQQINAVARSGSKWIRFGGSIPDDGDWTYLDTAVGLCNKYGLKIIMVIQPSTSYGIDYITLTCKTFAYRYNGKDGRGFVDIFQIWNEVCSELMKDKYGGSAPDGISEDCYFTIPVDGAKDLPEYLEYYTAAEQGIHSKDCSSKFMVNFAQTHCGMITYFLRNGLKIDVVGWDLYCSKKDREESAQNMSEIYDIVEEKIYNAYKLPIMLCETNIAMNTISLQEQKDAELSSYQRLIDNIYLAYKRPWLKAALFYELLDEPRFGDSSPEAWYGLIKNPEGGIGATDTKYEKPIYKEIQKLLNGNADLKMIMRSEVNLKPYEKLVVNTADDSHLNKKEDDTEITTDTTTDNEKNKDNSGNGKKQDNNGGENISSDNNKKDSINTNKQDNSGNKKKNTNTGRDKNYNGGVEEKNDDTTVELETDDTVDDIETDFEAGLELEDTYDDVLSDDDTFDQSENVVSITAPDQVKVINSKKRVYKIPWLIVILSGAGFLAAGAATIVIYLKISNTSNMK